MRYRIVIIKFLYPRSHYSFLYRNADLSLRFYGTVHTIPHKDTRKQMLTNTSFKEDIYINGCLKKRSRLMRTQKNEYWILPQHCYHRNRRNGYFFYVALSNVDSQKCIFLSGLFCTEMEPREHLTDIHKNA